MATHKVALALLVARAEASIIGRILTATSSNISNFTIMLLTSIVTLVLAIVILKAFSKFQHQQSLKTDGVASAPAPSHWFFGQLLDLFPKDNMKTTILFMQKFKEYSEATRQKSKFFKLDFLNPFIPYLGRTSLFVTDADALQDILKPATEVKLVKGGSYKVAGPLIGDGVLSSPTVGDRWKHNRKTLERGFKLENLKKSHLRINSVVDRCVQRWTNEASFHDWFDIREEMLRLTMDVICQVGLGKDYEDLHRADIPGPKQLYWIINTILVRMAATANRPPWYTRLEKRLSNDPEVAEYWNKFEILKTAMYRLIDERLETLADPTKKAELERNDWTELKPGTNPGTLIDAIVDVDQTGEPIMSRKQMLDEIQTLIFAGHDTTGNTLAWCLWELANSPETLSKLEKEVLKVAGERTPPEFGDMDAKMPYLNSVIKEVLRLHPPAGFTRLTLEPVMLGGVAVPRDTDIMIFPYLLHLDPRYFDKPESFIPERWLPGSTLHKDERAYFPFSLNQRNCVGMKLAQLELRVVLVRLIQEFEFEAKPERPIDYLAMTLNPEHVPMKVKPRQRQLAA